jgi:hypothetical protein
MTDPWFLENRPIQDESHRKFVNDVRRLAADWGESEIGSSDTQTWVYDGEGGAQWIMLSMDFLHDGSIQAALRLDVDSNGIRGGWSPGILNWDESVPAAEAEVDFGAPDGIRVDTALRGDIDLAKLAVDWFESHERQFGSRTGRWAPKPAHGLRHGEAS